MMNILNAGLKSHTSTPTDPQGFVSPNPTSGLDYDFEEKTLKPRVEKFASNIYYDEFWTESVYHDYFRAFWEGYRMTSYQQASECEEEFGNFMNVIHEFNLNMTRRRLGGVEQWLDPYRLVFFTMGNSFNEFWYNCFRWGYDVYDSYKTKFDNFVDFGDIYLSFIFNMLANSISIKSDVENMIDAFAVHDTEKFVRGLASILRSILDF